MCGCTGAIKSGCKSSCAKTTCASIIAQVECLPNIYQGDDETIIIQFFDQSCKALDISKYSFYAVIFDLLSTILATYSYPLDSTSDLEIKILQELDTNGDFINKGKISIQLTSDLTSKMITGPVSLEIKLIENDDTFPNGIKTKRIGCLQIAEIKFSKINTIE